MKHLTKTIAALVGITILLSACKKDDEPVVSPPEPVPGSIELQSYFNQNISDEVEAFTIDAGSNENIISSKGTQLVFYSNSLQHANGTLVTGNVTIELL